MIIKHILNKLRLGYYSYTDHVRRNISLQELAYKVQGLEGEVRVLRETNKRFQEIYDFLGVCRNTIPATNQETKLGKCPKTKKEQIRL